MVAGSMLAACGGSSTTESVSVPPETAASATTSATSTPASDSSTAQSTTGGSTAAASTAASSTGTASTPAASTPGTSTPGTSASTGAALTLETDGLLIAGGARPATHYPFGSNATAVRAALATVLGGPLSLTPSPECGQGPRTTADRNNVTILIDGTSFVGWIDQGAPRRHLTTRRGLGVGSTLTQVKVLLSGVTVSNETLGPEFFTTSGLGGLLTGTTNSSTVTNIYAGETCFFR
jgi:hypothetical protein